jgi:hypothetical protein
MMTKRKKMIAYNSNEGFPHTGVVWFLWCAADSAYAFGQFVGIKGQALKMLTEKMPGDTPLDDDKTK